tara:strand:+ start:435 stop:884 length:450 start_codon:yes stop_codon:yes gene_type:complete
MAVAFNKISYGLIENGLRKLLDDEFDNVYVSNVFKQLGNESIRINLLSSNNIETHAFYERREYIVNLKYYFVADMSKPYINEGVKNKIDRLKRHLINNQNVESTTAKWAELTIENIEYDVKDDDNEDNPELYIAEFNLSLINHNPFGDE